MAATSETSQDDSPLRLSVSNFGPIAEADIELRPLTVFVGPSNTGKSYLAKLVYALHNTFSQIFSLHNTISPAEEIKKNASLKLTKQEQNNFTEWASRTFSSTTPELDINDELNYRIPTEIQKIFCEFIKHRYSNIVEEEIERCFGVGNINSLIRYGSSKKNSDIEIHLNSNETHNSLKTRMNITRTSLEFSTKIPENLLQIYDIHAKSLVNFNSLISRRIEVISKLSENHVSEIIINRITGEITRKNMKEFLPSAYYLPADRTGVMHAHQVLMTSLIKSATKAGISNKLRLPILSGLLGDFLEELLAMSKESENTDCFPSAATRLEKEILDGSVHSEGKYEDIAYPEFTYQPYGWNKKLPLMNSSSMVSDLAPVVLYLRHMVRIGNTLIIEEPESHLHPSKQVEFIRQLALLSKEGIRIIITTHSQWVLEAISNIIKVSELPAPQRNGLPSEKIDLKPNDIGIWLFKPSNRPKGSVINEIKIKDNSIDLPDDYYEVMLSLYNEHVEADDRMSETSAS